MRLKLLIITSLLFFLAACSHDVAKDADHFIGNARKYIESRQFNNAIIEYKNAIQSDPENDTALFELAETYVLVKKIETAIRYYEDAAKVNPENLVARMRLAQIYLKTDRLYESRTRIAEILARDPKNVQALHLLSSIQIKERDLNAAVQTLEEAEKFDPSVIKTFLSLAQLYIASGNVKKAEEAYLKAVELDPNQHESYMGLVNLYNSQGKFDKSGAVLESVINKPGEKSVKYIDAAHFYEERGMLEKAEEYYSRAVAESSDRHNMVELIKFYARHGKRDSALEYIGKILSDKSDKSDKKISADILTEIAKVYIQYGMVSDADALIDKALKKDSRYADALLQRGKIRMINGDYAGAINSFDESLLENKINSEAYFYKAICIQKNESHDDSDKKLRRAAAGLLDDPVAFKNEQVKKNLKAAILTDPKAIEPRFMLTEIYILEKDKYNANEQLKDLVRMAPKHKKTVSLVTAMKLLEGDYKSAESILLAIVNSYPSDQPANLRLGILYKSQGKNEEALYFFKKAYEIDRTQTGIIRLIVDILKDEKRFDEAVSFVKDNMNLTDTATKTIMDSIQGEILFSEGKLDDAFKLFNNSVKNNDKDIKSYIMIARIYELKKQFDMALQTYLKVEPIAPNSVPVLMGIGLNYERLGNLSGAERYYRKTLEHDPNHPYVANNLAFILSRNDSKIDEAFSLAQVARQGRPKDANILDTLGWLYYKKGSYYIAISTLEESLQLNPDNPLACFHMGMCLYQTKDFEKARFYLNKALKIDPHFDGSDLARNFIN